MQQPSIDYGIITRQSVFILSFYLQNYFARNFYNMRMLALFVAFAINFILLFYKVNLSRDYFSSCMPKNIQVL